ncbi:MAG: chorismate synthase [Oscillospiraceae bacterium]|nr:chorismate synthase [Oscillospiraceae bacterium]
MSSTYGERFRFTIFGQSHSPAIGVTIEGIPAGSRIDTGRLQLFLERRAPGHDATATPRKEADYVEFLCGIKDGITCGTPLTAIIRNTNTRSGDYDKLRTCPRPGHADYTGAVRYKDAQDPAGGGHFSGRLTAPLCIAGGIALQLLAQQGITIGSHIQTIEAVADDAFDPMNISAQALKALAAMRFPVLREGAEEEMRQAVLDALQDGDSVGGIIECAAVGLPAGWGDPMFGGMENRIAQIVFGIPAVRGLEFGAGFAAAAMRGSRHNDPFVVKDGSVTTATNHHGGILGGITSGMPLLFRAAIKPTPSIGMTQHTADLKTGEQTELSIGGRHDPCIVPRAVPVMEAAAAAAIYDAYLCSL